MRINGSFGDSYYRRIQPIKKTDSTKDRKKETSEYVEDAKREKKKRKDDDDNKGGRINMEI